MEALCLFFYKNKTSATVYFLVSAAVSSAAGGAFPTSCSNDHPHREGGWRRAWGGGGRVEEGLEGGGHMLGPALLHVKEFKDAGDELWPVWTFWAVSHHDLWNFLICTKWQWKCMKHFFVLRLPESFYFFSLLEVGSVNVEGWGRELTLSW